MWPVIAKLGPITIRGYGLMIALGFLTALFLAQRDAKKRGIDANVIADTAFWALLMGLAGTRVLHIAMYPQDYSWHDPVGWVAIWRGGLVFQGGPPAAILFCYYYLRTKQVDPWKVADLAFPYLALGHAMGRIGCFLNGCCYGTRTSLPWGCSFPPGSPAHQEQYGSLAAMTSDWSFRVHPTQLYEAMALVGICLLLLFLRRKWHPFDGFTMPVYFILYSTWRFFVEFIRGDRNPVHFAPLTDQQVLCLAFIALGIGLFLALRLRHNRR